MNTITLTPQQALDYRTTMQREAAAFIERNQGQHLDDDSLFERTVRHLVTGRNVPVFMADRLVHLAMGNRLPAGAAWVGVDMASGPDHTPRRVADQDQQAHP